MDILVGVKLSSFKDINLSIPGLLFYLLLRFIRSKHRVQYLDKLYYHTNIFKSTTIQTYKSLWKTELNNVFIIDILSDKEVK